jgi:hypothetical protein
MPAWASLDATSGTLAAGATRTLTLNFNISGLTAGNQTASLTFTGGPSPVSLSLSLALAAPGTAPTTGTSSTLTVTPAALSGEYTIGGAMPPTQRVSIRNMGTSTMYWNATSNVAWLKVSPSSGALVPSAALTLTVSCTPSSSMAVGTTVGVITLTGGSSPRTINYSLTVKSATPTAPAISGVLTASPRVMAFSGASQTKPLTITNTGGTSLRWFASPTFSWMRLSLDYGTLAPGASVTINVTVSNAGLSPKLYAGAINISAGTIRTSVTVQYTPFLTTTQTAIIKAELRQDRPLAPERWALVPRAQRLARLVNG